MRLDRSDMRKILEALHAKYPEHVPLMELVVDTCLDGTDIGAASHYLEEHGLIEVILTRTIGTPRANSVHRAKITARGIDFILDDGGLSAILGVVTVKLHEDTIRAMLLNGIEAHEAPESEKSALREAIKKAPSTAFNETVKALVGLALREAPGAMQLLQSYFLTTV